MSDKEWDQVHEVHLKGAFSCTKAAWPIFRKQKFGRIINTASAAGLYGNMGQANYSAAKMGLVGFTKTLAREGAKYNIKASVIAPIAASPMTATIMSPEMLAGLKPEFVAPLIGVLTHPDGPDDVSGKCFEVGAGFVAEIRWERSGGAVFKTDESFSPSAVRARWDEIVDFSRPEYPQSMVSKDGVATLEESKKLPTNKQFDPPVRFDGQTIIITGAGAGLGRAYALMFARLGGNIVVNDVSPKGANAVVEEIKKAGGKAVPAVFSAENGEAIVKVALDSFGSVHALVANAGILRDKSFTAMSDKEWDDVIAVHLKGTYKCCKAVWDIFQKQTYGRILTTASGVGIWFCSHSSFQYSTAKAAIIGLTRTLAIEGKRYGILANVIAPNAGTAMTSTIWYAFFPLNVQPDYIAPVVGYLISSANEETTGSLFEISGGWAAQTRWQRAFGHSFPNDKTLTPERVLSKWDVITRFDGRATHPTSTQEALMQIMGNFENTGEEESDSPYADPEDSEYTYTERDKELQWVFENHEEFQVLPSFGVVPQFPTSSSLPLDFLPNFNPAKLLHGEQYLSIKKPIPTSGTLVSTARLLEVLDKGKAAAVTVVIETRDKASNELICENQSTVFVRGSGGLGGRKTGKDRGPATAANNPPKRKPDAVVEEKTLPQQAAIYRLSGDYNPLHIQPEFAAIGGFDNPILHGQSCFIGISGKHILKTFGPWKDIKIRRRCFPGETLVTSMWKESDKVIFVTKAKERDSIVLGAAAATLQVPETTKTKAKL
ncbi:putative multifunctional beta-oxidation protein [Cantharellus anzutake]|uniref:putative multifunctional beta-oxidation protein n=1 Tax=Cantharellus anzutake TaxID=1750568 RepID=UPI0019056F54|nr:putative multifunctional beta-oxidation protein [Cantharellus anzutake]KAF8340524.1 putative multifunctional beta-oxidation protein [Cantharellus anzutake]